MKTLLPSLCVLLLTVAGAHAVDVLTQHNNLSRTGANLDESILTQNSAGPWSFREQWAA